MMPLCPLRVRFGRKWLAGHWLGGSGRLKSSPPVNTLLTPEADRWEVRPT